MHELISCWSAWPLTREGGYRDYANNLLIICTLGSSLVSSPLGQDLKVMDELWAVLSSPLWLAVTAVIALVVYLYYRYLGCMYDRLQTSDSRAICSLMCWNCHRRNGIPFIHLSSFLPLLSPPSFVFLPSYAYAPFQVLKRYGIKGPQPVPFYGNYKEAEKVVSLEI